MWDENGDFITDKDKDRSQGQALQDQRLDAQVLREQRKHADGLEKIRQAHDLKTQEKTALTELERETAITLTLLEQGLLPEKLDLEFNDMVRRADIELQTLQAELNMRDEIDQREQARKLDSIYQSTMMEITKETARLLDEQNKSVAINQQETKSTLILEAQQHRQNLEQEEQLHAHGMKRDVLQSGLKKDEFTHEEFTQLAVRIIARERGLDVSEVSPDIVAEWVEGFEGGF